MVELGLAESERDGGDGDGDGDGGRERGEEWDTRQVMIGGGRREERKQRGMVTAAAWREWISITLSLCLMKCSDRNKSQR